MKKSRKLAWVVLGVVGLAALVVGLSAVLLIDSARRALLRFPCVVSEVDLTDPDMGMRVQRKAWRRRYDWLPIVDFVLEDPTCSPCLNGVHGRCAEAMNITATTVHVPGVTEPLANNRLFPCLCDHKTP